MPSKFEDLYREIIQSMLPSDEEGGSSYYSPRRFEDISTKQGLEDAILGRQTSKEGNPRKFIDPTDPNYQESIYAEPTPDPTMDTGGMNVMGQITGLSTKMAKLVRKAMQQEVKARGPAPFNQTTASSVREQPPGYPKLDIHLMDKYGDDLAAYKEGGSDLPDAIATMIHLNVVDQKDIPALMKHSQDYIKADQKIAPIEESRVVSNLLRGTWYRGQDKYPTGHQLEEVIGPSGTEKAVTVEHFGRRYANDAPTFAGLKTNLSNLGEPHGISLSYDPTISTGFNAPKTLTRTDYDVASNKFSTLANQAYDDLAHYGKDSPEGAEALKEIAKYTEIGERADKLKETHKVARVMPIFGGTPEDKVLMPWREDHGKIFRDTYLKVARDMTNEYPLKREEIEALNPGTSGQQLGDLIGASTKSSKGASFNTDRYTSAKDEFNSRMSDELRSQGWKGMLHHPDRGGYSEYEMRMFDPYDVMFIDKRAIPKAGYEFETNKMASQSAGRLRQMKEPLKEAHQEVTAGKTRSLADWYKDITREEILGHPKLDELSTQQAEILDKKLKAKYKAEAELDFAGFDELFQEK